MGNGLNDADADANNFSVPDENSEVTIHFFDSQERTSADDTVTDKYFDSNQARKTYVITADKTFVILEINGVVLTRPWSVVTNSPFSEKEIGAISNIKIKTETANTTVSIFCR